jgi:hypothetical protein
MKEKEVSERRVVSRRWSPKGGRGGGHWREVGEVVVGQ